MDTKPRNNESQLPNPQRRLAEPTALSRTRVEIWRSSRSADQRFRLHRLFDRLDREAAMDKTLWCELQESPLVSSL
jgi:hypothetical protein